MARILLIDDDKDFLRTLKKAVELFGHQADTGTSVEEAVQLVRKLRPDVVITDLNLGTSDGLSLIGWLKSNPDTASIPIIVHSASESKSFAGRMIEAGASEFLEKPAALRELLHVIERYSPSRPVKTCEGKGPAQ